MDPVTHSAAGLLAGRTLAGAFPSWKILIFCLAAAWLPDIDSFIGLGPENYLLHHRAFTHSLVGIPVLAALLAGLFRLMWRQLSFWSLFAVGCGVMVLQVYLDLATTFGTLVLWPFTDTRFGFPGVFIIDPLFTLTLLILLSFSFIFPRRRGRLAKAGIGVALLYPLISFGIGSLVGDMLPSRINGQGPSVRELHVTTDLLTPYYWKVIAEEENTYGIGAVDLTLEMPEPPFVVYPKADPETFLRLGEQASLFHTWFWFARYPAILSVRETPRGTETTYGDLRFLSRSPVGLRLFPDFEPPFTLTALVDAQGQLLAYRYNRHGETAMRSVPD